MFLLLNLMHQKRILINFDPALSEIKIKKNEDCSI